MPVTTYQIAFICPAPVPATGPAPAGTGDQKGAQAKILPINAAGSPAANPFPGEHYTWASSNPAIAVEAIDRDVDGNNAVLVKVATPNPYSATPTTIEAVLTPTSNVLGAVPYVVHVVATQPPVTPFDEVGFTLGSITYPGV